jgi:hypothetical protein
LRSPLLTEAGQRSAIMSAAEVQLLIDDLLMELAVATDSPQAGAQIARFSQCLEAFIFDWRQLCALHGIGGHGRPDFQRLAHTLHNSAKPLSEGLTMRTNAVSALLVLEKRVLQHLVADGAGF